MLETNETIQELHVLLNMRGFICGNITHSGVFSTSVTNNLTALVGKSGKYFELRFAETHSRKFVRFNQQYDCLRFTSNGVTILSFPELLRILCQLKYINPEIMYYVL